MKIMYNPQILNNFYVQKENNFRPHLQSFPCDSFQRSVTQVNNDITFGGLFDFFKRKQKNDQNVELVNVEQERDTQIKECVEKILTQVEELKEDVNGPVAEPQPESIPQPELTPPPKTKSRSDIMEEALKECQEACTIEEFRDGFERYMSQIKNKNEEVDIIKCAINSLPAISYTEENAQKYEEIVESLYESTNRTWSDIVDENGNNIVHRIVDAQNVALMKLAVGKGFKFDVKNNDGKSAKDMVLEAPDFWVKLGIKIPCSELNSLVKDDLLVGAKMIVGNPIFDLNTKDAYGNTPLMNAILGNSDKCIDLLISNPEVDRNTVCKDFERGNYYRNKNVVMILAERGDVERIRILNKFEDFDINCSGLNKYGVFVMFKDKATYDALMENPKVNINGGCIAPIHQVINMRYDCFHYTDTRERFEILANDRRVDLSVKNGKGQDVFEAIGYDEEFKEILKEAIAHRFIKDIKDMVSRDGILPLKKISEFCNHSSITRKHINVPLNPQGETIGFFLADVGLNIGNIGEFKALLDGLKTKGYDFNHKNEFGQTLLDKAKDAENEFLVEYLTNIGRKK